MNPKAVVLLSGGLDSSTAAALAIADGYKVIALSFRYGQLCLERELLSAQTVAQKLGITEHFIV
jgi:7-cyano-7-deazaguanine synthase